MLIFYFSVNSPHAFPIIAQDSLNPIKLDIELWLVDFKFL